MENRGNLNSEARNPFPDKRFIGSINIATGLRAVEGRSRVDKQRIYRDLVEKSPNFFSWSNPEKLTAICNRGIAALMFSPEEINDNIYDYHDLYLGEAIFALFANLARVNKVKWDLKPEKMEFTPDKLPISSDIVGDSLLGLRRLGDGKVVQTPEGLRKTHEIPEPLREPFLKLLYLLSNLPKKNIEMAFEQYEEYLTDWHSYNDRKAGKSGGKQPRGKTAYQGMYEIMNALGIRGIPPFTRLAGILEDKIIEDHFFQNSYYTSGQVLAEKKTEKRKEELGTTGGRGGDEDRVFLFPDLAFWGNFITERRRLKSEAGDGGGSKGERVVAAVRKSIVRNGGASEAYSEFKAEEQKRKEAGKRLKERQNSMLRLLEQRLIPKDPFDGRKFELYQQGLFFKAGFIDFCRQTINMFADDPNLGGRARSFIKNNQSYYYNDAYALDFEALSRDPFLRRMFVVLAEGKTDNLREGGSYWEWIKIDEANSQLFFRFLTYKVIKAGCQEEEWDFLFDRCDKPYNYSPRVFGVLESCKRYAPKARYNFSFQQWKEDRDELLAVRVKEFKEAAPVLMSGQSIERLKEIRGRKVDQVKYRLDRAWQKYKNPEWGKKVLKRAFVVSLIAGAGYFGWEIAGKIFDAGEKFITVNSGEVKTGMSIQRELMKKITPSYYGEVLEITEEMKGEGENLGLRYENLIPLGSRRQVAVYYGDDKAAGIKGLVYTTKTADFIYPPNGWEIISIRSKSVDLNSAKPVPLALGGIYFQNPKQLPSRIELTLQAEKETMLSSQIKILPEVLAAYAPEINIEEALHESQILGRDSVIGNLYNDFTQQVVSWQEKGGDNKELSDLILNNLLRLGEYVRTERYYALADIPEKESVLEYIAKNQEAGFYCEEAYLLSVDFLKHFGIETYALTGRDLLVYQNGEQLYNRNISHIQTLVYLPDGRFLRLDFTPPSTSRTPPEDLAALAIKPPHELELLSHKKEIRDKAEALGITSLLFAGTFLMVRKLKRKRDEAMGGWEYKNEDGWGIEGNKDEGGAVLSKTQSLLSIVTATKNDLALERVTAFLAYLVSLPEKDLMILTATLKRFPEMGVKEKSLLPLLWDRTMMLVKEMDDSDLLARMREEKIYSLEEQNMLQKIEPEDFRCLAVLARAIGEGGTVLMRSALSRAFGKEEFPAEADIAYEEFKSGLEKIIREL